MHIQSLTQIEQKILEAIKNAGGIDSSHPDALRLTDAPTASITVNLRPDAADPSIKGIFRFASGLPDLDNLKADLAQTTGRALGARVGGDQIFVLELSSKGHRSWAEMPELDAENALTTTTTALRTFEQTTLPALRASGVDVDGEIAAGDIKLGNSKDGHLVPVYFTTPLSPTAVEDLLYEVLAELQTNGFHGYGAGFAPRKSA